jgi:hypothetical protein
LQQHFEADVKAVMDFWTRMIKMRLGWKITVEFLDLFVVNDEMSLPFEVPVGKTVLGSNWCLSRIGACEMDLSLGWLSQSGQHLTSSIHLFLISYWCVAVCGLPGLRERAVHRLVHLYHGGSEAPAHFHFQGQAQRSLGRSCQQAVGDTLAGWPTSVVLL